MATELVILLSWLNVKVSAETSEEAIAEAAFWSSLPNDCPKCGAGLGFRHRDGRGKASNKPYDYKELICKGSPQHYVQLHKNLPPKTSMYYLPEEEWQIVPKSLGGFVDVQTDEALDEEITATFKQGIEGGLWKQDDLSMFLFKEYQRQQLSEITAAQKLLFTRWLETEFEKRSNSPKA
jgi:hypothetical protein